MQTHGGLFTGDKQWNDWREAKGSPLWNLLSASLTNNLLAVYLTHHTKATKIDGMIWSARQRKATGRFFHSKAKEPFSYLLYESSELDDNR